MGKGQQAREMVMKRTAIIGATFAVLMTSVAFAQDTPAPGTNVVPPPPAAQQNPEPTAPDQNAQAPEVGATAPGTDDTTTDQGAADTSAQDQEMQDQETQDQGETQPAPMAEERAGEPERGWIWHRDHGPDGRGGPAHEGMGWGRHGGGFRHGFASGFHPPHGAFVRLSRGAGGPSITIKCADSDSTQECVDAIMPLLNRALHDR